MNLKTIIMQEMIKMLARQLDCSPAADELPFSAQVMTDDFIRIGLTDSDAERVSEAFQRLGPRVQRWPTSRMVIEALPEKKSLRLPPPLDSTTTHTMGLLNRRAAELGLKGSDKNEKAREIFKKFGGYAKLINSQASK